MPEKPRSSAEKQVRISAALHRRLSVYTAKNGNTNSAVAEQAIEDYLNLKNKKA
jgi:predicted transcriptional regulator